MILYGHFSRNVLISLNCSKASFRKFWGMRGKQRPEFEVTISTLHTKQVPCFVKPFHNFDTRLWICYHVTMNGPHLTCFEKLKKRRRDIVNLKLFDTAITTSIINCEVNLLLNVEVTPAQRCEFDVVVSTL